MSFIFSSAAATLAGVAGLPRNSISDIWIWSARPCEREYSIFSASVAARLAPTRFLWRLELKPPTSRKFQAMLA
jgi:hypothetical protein